MVAAAAVAAVGGGTNDVCEIAPLHQAPQPPTDHTSISRHRPHRSAAQAWYVCRRTKMEACLPSAMPTASAVAVDAAAARIPWMAPELAHVSLKYLDTVADVKWWVVRMLQLSGDVAANEPSPSMLVVDDLELFLEATFRIEGGQSGAIALGEGEAVAVLRAVRFRIQPRVHPSPLDHPTAHHNAHGPTTHFPTSPPAHQPTSPPAHQPTSPPPHRSTTPPLHHHHPVRDAEVQMVQRVFMHLMAVLRSAADSICERTGRPCPLVVCLSTEDRWCVEPPPPPAPLSADTETIYKRGGATRLERALLPCTPS